jgi:basic membrane protein A and related proteins
LIAARRWLVALLAALLTTSCVAEAPGTAATDERLRVAAVFATPIAEPWDHAIHAALQMAQDSLNIEYTYSESVTPDKYEKVLRDYADAGYDIIVGDAFAAEETARTVAKSYPGIAFAFGSGLGPAEPNFSVFDNWIHEPAFLAGLIAGKLTKSNLIGVVGAHPVPEVNRITNAFLAGARESNPSVQSRVVFIDSWYDPPRAKSAALRMIDEGVDVMYAERDGVIEAAAERKVAVFGNLIDQSAKSREHVVTSVVWNMWPTVRHLIQRVREGTYEAEDYAIWSMMGKGGSALAPLGAWEAKLDAATREAITVRRDAILNGRFRVSIDESTP